MIVNFSLTITNEALKLYEDLYTPLKIILILLTEKQLFTKLHVYSHHQIGIAHERMLPIHSQCMHRHFCQLVITQPHSIIIYSRFFSFSFCVSVFLTILTMRTNETHDGTVYFNCSS